MKKISVIVPIYNTEKYLSKCIESIIKQTYNELEIILVDDGSTDSSLSICEIYQKKDSRVKIVHQDNKGLSEARNVGIKIATGDYLAFIDSDDFIKEDSFEILMKATDTPDIIVGEAIRYLNKDNCFPKVGKRKFVDQIMTGEDFLKLCLKQNKLTMCVQFNLYSKKLIIDNNLFFKSGILHEDEWWTPQILMNAEKVYYSGYYFYYHVFRENSITSSKSNLKKRGKDLVNTAFFLSQLIKMQPLNTDREFIVLFSDYILMLFLSGYYSGKLYDERKKEKVRDKRFVVSHAHSFRNKLKMLIFCISPKYYCYINLIIKN